MSQLKNNPVIVTDYDPAWPDIFASLQRMLVCALGDTALAVEHVGSTAVPGLAAKPVIDVDVVVRREDIATAIEKLTRAGYKHTGDQGVPDREAFRQKGDLPAHHLYVCPADSAELARHLAFRDALRRDAELRDAYGRLKQRLALLYRDDRVAYTEAKSEFILRHSR
jgi:GrpB-like predicted nucleotidyltransferase (UPF0157 family)